MGNDESNTKTVSAAGGPGASSESSGVLVQLGEGAPKSSGENGVSDPELRTMFLEAASRGTDSADEFFNRFRCMQDVFYGRNYSSALQEGLFLLTKCKNIDAGVYQTIHKGTPFYWLGMAAFLVSDYETAAFLFDAAVSEDIRAGRNPTKESTPAFRFILVEGDQPGQAAKPLVLAMQNRLEAAISGYNAQLGRSPGISDLALPDVRQKFLLPALSTMNKRWRSLATALISYFLEWDYRSTLIDLRPGPGTAEPFFLHLFKGCVLFESLLKANPTAAVSGKMLGQVLDELSSALGIPPRLGIGGGVTFPMVVGELASANDEVKTAVRFAGRIRNTVGHDLGWEANLDRSQYDKLASMVASSFLHAIACLYR